MDRKLTRSFNVLHLLPDLFDLGFQIDNQVGNVGILTF